MNGFDDCHIYGHFCKTCDQCMERLYEGDWAKGPQGTGETGLLTPGYAGLENMNPALCTGWEMPDEETFIIHVRQGVFWQDKPPVNGRELTADDIKFSLELKNDPGRCPLRSLQSYCPLGLAGPIEVIDRYTVSVKIPPELLGMYQQILFSMTTIKPPEPYELYGDMTDWHYNVGTAALQLKDYIPDQVIVMEANPNYYAPNPLYPDAGPRPFVDEVRMIKILDDATKQAALKSGKIDWIRWTDVDQGDTIIRDYPRLQYLEYLTHITQCVLYCRHDVPPFSDIRVRQAMMMAVDQQGYLRDMLGGRGSMLAFNIPPYPENMSAFVEYEDLPEDIKRLYQYRPDDARALLAEAGYPNGFKAEVVVTSAKVPLLSILVDYLDDVGIELEMKVMEPGAFAAFTRAEPRAYPHCCVDGAGLAVPRRVPQWMPGDLENRSVYDASEEYFYIWNNWFDFEKREAKVTEMHLRMKREVLGIALPNSNVYRLWQPWVKGYGGEQNVGNQMRENWTQFVWLDLDLKKEILGHE